MTLPAGDRLVLPFQGKPGSAMVKSEGLEIDFPAFRIVAIIATQAKILSMRRFLGMNHHDQKKGYNY
jgi:hypothetical protein